jgi:hypothetical protein
MNDALNLVMLVACAFVALLLAAAVAVGLWSTTARSKSRPPR